MGLCGSRDDPQPVRQSDLVAPPVEAPPIDMPMEDRFFAGAGPASRHSLRASSELVEFLPGQRIVEEGERVTDASCMYVLAEGSVDVRAEVSGVVATLQPPAVFGELAVLFGNFRTAAVVAREAGRAFALARRDLQRLIPGLQYPRNLCFLRTVDVLRGLSDQRLGDLTERARTVDVRRGQVVVE